MPHALCLSPHLDDGVFSVGGLLADLARRGWSVTLATIFTRSAAMPEGFALACQLDKGLGPELDYMALRRAEDREACAVLGIKPLWLDLPEAPHRGYGSAAALFGPMLAEDDVWREVAARVAAHPADWLLAPQALGRHVDHRQTVRAVLSLGGTAVAWYRDLPYAIRAPGELPEEGALQGLPETAWPMAATLPAKIAAAAAYRSQLRFQFRGPGRVAAMLGDFALAEGSRRGLGGPAEILRGFVPPGLPA